VKRLRFVSVLIIVAGLLAACSKPTPEPVTYTLEMTEYAFEPSVIEAKVGQPVTLEVVNNGSLSHEVMFGQNVRMTLSRPDGYQYDLFAKAGVEPQMEGGETEMDMAEHGHGATNFMLTLSKTGERATITFTPTEEMVGDWEMGCFEQEGVHYDAGMKGILTITE